MLSLSLSSSKTKESFFENQELGRGELGRVYSLLDKDKNPTNLVCKEVNIRQGTGWALKDFLSPSERLQFTLNELRNLKKLGLLLGYKRKDDTFYIIMKKIDGVSAYKSNHPEKVQHMFNALRSLHRKGVAHLDSHSGNFMVNETPLTADSPLEVHPIDFNLAEEATYINTALDNLIFFKMSGTSLKSAISFYIAEMTKYALENKVATCQQVLILAALCLSSIYGIPALAITHLMVKEFISAMLMRQFAKEISSKGLEYFVYYLLERKVPDKRTLVNLIHVISLIKSCLSVYLMYSQFLYHLNKSEILRLLSLDKINGWSSIFKNIRPEQIVDIGLMFFPIIDIISNIDKIIEEHVLTESLVKKKCDLLFKFSCSKKATPVVNACKIDTDNINSLKAFPQV